MQQEMESHEQVTLMGHTANICAISAAAASPLIASAQEGPLALVRLWDRAAGVCLAILQQHASDMQARATPKNLDVRSSALSMPQSGFCALQAWRIMTTICLW